MTLPGQRPGRLAGTREGGVRLERDDRRRGSRRHERRPEADVLARDTAGVLWLYPGNGRGDFNGDARNDVLAVDAAGALWLYKGSGAGAWLGRVQAGSGWN